MNFALTEIFYTIQGEGFHAGTPAIFIRLSACNLRCPWCDTDFSFQRVASHHEVVDEVGQILNTLPDSNRVLFVITGGEPTLQNYAGLVEALGKFPNLCTLETNGRSCSDPAMLHLRRIGRLFVTASPKLKEEDCLPWFKDPDWRGDELKIVLDPAVDQALLSTLPFTLRTRFTHFYIQPCSENFEPAVQFVKENPSWKLSVQTQKVAKIR